MKLLLNLKERQIENNVVDNHEFVKGWPSAKIVLVTLQAVINNAVARFVIGLAIQVGDFVYDKKK